MSRESMCLWWTKNRDAVRKRPPPWHRRSRTQLTDPTLHRPLFGGGDFSWRVGNTLHDYRRLPRLLPYYPMESFVKLLLSPVHDHFRLNFRSPAKVLAPCMAMAAVSKFQRCHREPRSRRNEDFELSFFKNLQLRVNCDRKYLFTITRQMDYTCI